MYLAHLEKLGRTRLEDVLVEEGVLERPRVEDAQAEQEQTGKQLGEILIDRGIITDYDLAKLVATHYSLPYLDVTGYSTRREVMDLLPAEYCAQHAILPLDQFGMTITLAVSEMPGSELIDDIVEKTKLTPFLFVAQRRALMNVLDEEKKRGANRAATKRQTAVSATVASTVAAPATAPVTGPVAAAAPAESPRPTTSGGSVRNTQPLPDLVLPTVSMKLVGGAGGSTKAPPPAPARPRDTTVGAKPRETPPARPAPAPQGGTASKTGAALSWMDAIGGGSSPRGTVAGSGDPNRPKIQKFPFPTTPGQRPPTSVSPTRATSVTQKPAAGPPRGTVAATKPGATPPATPGKPAAAWQSIFDVGEESVKEEKRRTNP
jgi:hypothetical protein